MARFKALIARPSGEWASRTGDKVATAITGGQLGVEVRAEPQGDTDVFYLYGINGHFAPPGRRQYLGLIHLDEHGAITFEQPQEEEREE